jgi:hypothetical protein
MMIRIPRSRVMFRAPGVTVAMACCILLGAHASTVCAEGTVPDSLLDGVWSAQARYRLESVDDDGPRRSATASTLRTRIGFETDPERALGAFLQIEDVRAIGAEKFDSTTNGNGQYGSIPDPDSTELNQAYLSLRRGSSTARAGRQALVFDNARFIGDVDFRQNQQTYDALLLQHAADDGSRFTYAYSWRVERVFGEDHPLGGMDMRSHLMNYSLRRLGGDRVAAYAYLLEFGPAALPSAFASTQTYGASYDGTIDIGTHKAMYRAEYARQSDYADTPPMNSWYANAELGWRLPNQWLGTVGVEVLGGDGEHAFQTPLATLHKFNGFADLFAASTPADGLEDRYARLAAPWYGVRLAVAWHDFRAHRGDLQYGEELDAQVSWRANSHVLLGVKYADYKARGFAVDTRKAWLWVEVGL